MDNLLNRKLAEMLGKMDQKVLEARLNAALDMLKNGNTEELAKKLGKMDKNELMKKINEFDESRLKELNLNKNELAQKISNADLENLARIIGENGDEIVKKIKDIIK